MNLKNKLQKHDWIISLLFAMATVVVMAGVTILFFGFI